MCFNQLASTNREQIMKKKKKTRKQIIQQGYEIKLKRLMARKKWFLDSHNKLPGIWLLAHKMMFKLEELSLKVELNRKLAHKND